MENSSIFLGTGTVCNQEGRTAKGPWPTLLSDGQGTSYQERANHHHHFVTRPKQRSTGEHLCTLKGPGDSTGCPASHFPITGGRT